MTHHERLIIRPTTTREQIQAEISYYRAEARRLPAFAHEYAELIDEAGGYLDALLEREPEPAA